MLINPDSLFSFISIVCDGLGEFDLLEYCFANEGLVRIGVIEDRRDSSPSSLALFSASVIDGNSDVACKKQNGN